MMIKMKAMKVSYLEVPLFKGLLELSSIFHLLSDLNNIVWKYDGGIHVAFFYISTAFYDSAKPLNW